MRIKYFGENKENGTGRVAVIRFTDNEFDLYEYIANYEKAYGDSDREFFNGSIIGIERDENGVWINEAWINVDDFTDFNDLKANYKEAKKEFNSLKKQATEKTETTTKPETTEAETATETNPETATDPETAETEATTEKAWTVTQFPHVVRTFDKNGKMVYESFFETAEKAYDEYVDIIENSKENLPHGEELTVVRYADGRIMCSETIKGTCIYNSMQKSKATEDTADQSETAESDTKQYECENVVQVAHKVADLTNTRLDRQSWKGYCDEVKKDGSSWFDYTAFDSGGNEFDVSIFLGYDQQCRHYFVSVDYEKCPVPDMSGGT